MYLKHDVVWRLGSDFSSVFVEFSSEDIWNKIFYHLIMINRKRNNLKGRLFGHKPRFSFSQNRGSMVCFPTFQPFDLSVCRATAGMSKWKCVSVWLHIHPPTNLFLPIYLYAKNLFWLNIAEWIIEGMIEFISLIP